MTVPTGGFNGGTPMESDCDLAVNEDGTIANYVAGLPYDVEGRLVVTLTGPAVVYVAGIPITASGMVYADNESAVAYHSQCGIPHALDGAVSMIDETA